MGPGAMTMTLLVSPDFELREMAGYRVVGHRYMKALCPGAPPKPFDESKFAYIRDEVSPPNTPSEMFARIRKEIGLSLKTVIEDHRVIKYKLLVMIETEDKRGVGDHQEA